MPKGIKLWQLAQDYAFQLYEAITLGLKLALGLLKNPYVYIHTQLYVFCKTSSNISSTQLLPYLQDRPIGESLEHCLSLSEDFGFC